MFSYLKEKCIHYFCTFTYRKRFIFFALIFFLFIPLPSYFVFRTLKFYIQSIDLQLQGGKYQELIGSILNTSLKYEILLFDGQPNHYQKKSTLLALEDKEASLFKTLQNLESDQSDESYVQLGYGFSIKKPPKVESSEWEQAWKDMASDGVSANESKRPILDKLNSHIADELKKMGFKYTMFGNNNMVIFSLTYPTITQLVDIQILIKNLAMDLLQINQNPTVALVFQTQLQELKKNTPSAWKKYDMALREFRQQNPDKAMLQSQLQKRVTEYFVTLDRYLTALESVDMTKDHIVRLSIDSLEASQQLRATVFDTTEIILKERRVRYTMMFWTLFLAFVIGIVVIFLYLILKMLTGHMNKLKEHIEEMIHGNFSPCFCSNDKDEFGDIGRTFDMMSQSIVKIAYELRDLGRKLAEATLYLTRATREQGFTVYGQEIQTKSLEETAQEINRQQCALMERTKAYNQETSQTFSVEKAKTLLDNIQAKMSNLVETSSAIILLLTSVEGKVNGLSTLIAFMNKVSEGANLLSLNASIETANIVKNKESFAAISQKIQRFAFNTADATKNIHTIVNVMSTNMIIIKEDALECLEEINAGAQQLIEVSNQLTKIAKQGNEQWRKYEKFTSIIEEQINMTGSMIQSITQLRKAAQNNTLMIQNLHKSLADLGLAASQLQHTLTLFGTMQLGEDVKN